MSASSFTHIQDKATIQNITVMPIVSEAPNPNIIPQKTPIICTSLPSLETYQNAGYTHCHLHDTTPSANATSQTLFSSDIPETLSGSCWLAIASHDSAPGISWRDQPRIHDTVNALAAHPHLTLTTLLIDASIADQYPDEYECHNIYQNTMEIARHTQFDLQPILPLKIAFIGQALLTLETAYTGIDIVCPKV